MVRTLLASALDVLDLLAALDLHDDATLAELVHAVLVEIETADLSAVNTVDAAGMIPVGCVARAIHARFDPADSLAVAVGKLAPGPPDAGLLSILDSVYVGTTSSPGHQAARKRLWEGMHGDTMPPLSESQTRLFDAINARMAADYSVRRSVLLTRLGVTLKTFARHPVLAQRPLVTAYAALAQSRLRRHTSFSWTDVTAAQVDLAINRKTSDARYAARTPARVKHIVIASKVRDRGGRPSDMRMPSFRARVEPAPASRGRGRGRRSNDRNRNSNRNRNRDNTEPAPSPTSAKPTRSRPRQRQGPQP
ncbi:uncharacterized protein AMSG_08927 [Thecamonas trahens ATCC 50062]|uniref:Uncharacterized protein n=1 Tax=Thecamonas trahens ATCC 50062 TaxID=461836 RepID=A0A0L0DMC3_THETB|nr:hypothetical protein AMSG_08927 [Thecamonas trahens ATCC 50062]KNC53420.1 hypothetical protein AMSG_08927 [Thecamonas trahens ATCC 50062]|eukprot:XP_013754458.1 hypothetical protein AMSG_08927 [Thecamonas trahens ATCC 50062]